MQKAAKAMYHRVDPEFKHRLLKLASGETLKLCYQCGTCTASCPISHFVDTYRPNKILHVARLGITDVAFSNSVMMCSACTSCTKRCPQGVKVHRVMHALKGLLAEDERGEEFIAGEFKEVLASLGNEIPIPVTYAWICLSPVAEEEKRSKFDSLVIEVLRGALKDCGKPPVPANPARAEKVAIIGSGPAGLMAAWELGKAGFQVTIFDSSPEPGGMLRTGIPEYRLPKDVVATEVGRLKGLGVTIKTDTLIEKALFDHPVKGEEYKAIFVATGAPASRKLRVEGEDLDGVVPALKLLRDYNLNGQVKVGKRVVVIGGGNVAMDAARTALRCGAESVKLFCLESSEEMPAHEWEINDAVAEGVAVNPSWGPKKFLGDGGKVSGVEFVRCTSVFDEMKRFKPTFDESKTETHEADTVICAIGQASDLSFAGNDLQTNRGVIVVDPLTLKTNLPNVFAGGDAVSGTASVVEALVAGRVAAGSIARCLSGAKR